MRIKPAEMEAIKASTRAINAGLERFKADRGNKLGGTAEADIDLILAAAEKLDRQLEKICFANLS